MSTSKHPSPARQPVTGEDDLTRNPGIGQSAGLQNGDEFELIEGDSTTEGDVDNETDANGGVDPDHRPRASR